ncbi:DEAD/DEAH box helicase [Halobacillus salinarum]|uniref:DEAD/DEAH box helicase n=1 Tax=Halobacillus salinarum TaxID=2932257 RepID=A0ABY4EML6_9BACI|nr:helicase C-terminal domain-containing protein [Halobacillus salinarum]UOQ44852.1 DEAD/DEAH box helicase [Halobacillus salinarum]
MIDLDQKEEEILFGLKDFQKATVQRVYDLLTHGYTRVLVADEVGLGKTMIARGAIAKIARYHKENLNDPLFKVVYVCSNQNIARQNIQKLQIDEKVKLENSSDTRLSMQHLKIYENNYDQSLKDRYIQLTPLTPSTSFTMTSGCGSAAERALIFALLKNFHRFQGMLNELDVLLMDTATKSWSRYKEDYIRRVYEVNKSSGGEYVESMLFNIDSYLSKDSSFYTEIEEVCNKIMLGEQGFRKEATLVIHKLRKMMAEISVDIMDPDLVIMDEFQRFPELVNADGESETALLAKKFFNSPNASHEQKVKILLLSATPYKLYSTLEEINEAGEDEHYQEFLQVTRFLFEHHPQHKQHFERVWEDFSTSLRLFTQMDIAILQAKKQEAEESLYKGIARTERTRVDGSNELIKSSVIPLEITKEDVLSYIFMDRMLEEIGLTEKVPVEYVKSAPYLMSFMDHYKLKQKITQYVKKHPNQIAMVNKSNLWLKKSIINNYKVLPESNARLAKIKEFALPKNAERLLWVPPSLPYYESAGCYEEMEDFSKLLIFSAWEMVPRAVSTMVSYEAERLTVGELVKRTSKRKKRKSMRYFSERRFPQPRLSFSMKNKAPVNMNHLVLLYPSMALSRLFDPADVLKRRLTLSEIKLEIGEQIERLLDNLPHYSGGPSSREDERWYYLAPLLFDKQEAVVQEWFRSYSLLDNEKKDVGDQAALTQHLEALRSVFHSEGLIELGRQPEDLKEVLVNMVIGAPGVCALRMLGNFERAPFSQVVGLAKTLIDRMNTQEAISIVDLEYGSKRGGSRVPHWKNVLRYCVDGNIQAMLDEYSHMLVEESGIKNMESYENNEQLIHLMMTALNTHTASYNVDTYESFKNRAHNRNDKHQSMKIRTNYAVGFAGQRNEETAHNRKQNVRLAFNSPFRPFVLTTTSVGQEGLDFHYYCRRIAHWNLPPNPVDLEQREGRINRYKSFAIRKNIAKRYGDLPFKSDVWEEMFSKANEQERDEHTPELVPFWSLSNHQEIKLERIVPVYPFSKDEAKYDRLMKIMQLYRLSLGQARQEELLEYLFEHQVEKEKLEDLFMNLSPFYKQVRNRSMLFQS